jgi:hypothetical protein
MYRNWHYRPSGIEYRTDILDRISASDVGNRDMRGHLFFVFGPQYVICLESKKETRRLQKLDAHSLFDLDLRLDGGGTSLKKWLNRVAEQAAF